MISKVMIKAMIDARESLEICAAVNTIDALCKLGLACPNTWTLTPNGKAVADALFSAGVK